MIREEEVFKIGQFAKPHGIKGELPRHVEFQKGDTIVTSGYSAVFPSGIIVGTVADFEKQHDDNFYSLQVELAADFQALNNVRIIKNFRQTEQIGVEQEAKRND